ncbi:YopX family protein [Enterococcus gallinarum]|uniref:YopX family protein n=1 Tax=Enterococcus gallinarum TaxID=1353 RepID=UPI003D6A91F2
MVTKFRAWDKETQSLRCVLVIDWLNDLLDLDSGLIERQFDEVELMQSTGLKDKNGVEVFQGDIVRCTRGCPHEVVWLQEYAGMYVGGMPAWYLSGLSEGYAWTGEEEIIGNIYENPELLEEEK